MDKGLIKLIVLIIIAVIILSVLGVDLRSITKNELLKDNLGFLWDGTKDVWKNYLQKPFSAIWGILYNDVWLKLVNKN